eukprot:COSAG01_NODE_1715_length_9405_cov_5.798517_11_plen_80_part_01
METPGSPLARAIFAAVVRTLYKCAAAVAVIITTIAAAAAAVSSSGISSAAPSVGHRVRGCAGRSRDDAPQDRPQHGTRGA